MEWQEILQYIHMHIRNSREKAAGYQKYNKREIKSLNSNSE